MHAEIAREANGIMNRRSLLIGAMGAGVLPIASQGAFARSVETPATQEDERLIREAIAEAKLGDYPFGAVIVRDGKVLMVEVGIFGVGGTGLLFSFDSL